MARFFGPEADRAAPFRIVETLLPIEDYADREGFDRSFVNPEHMLPLPGLGRWGGDAVHLDPAAVVDDADPCELKYTHFSVVMSRSRRLPFFSAVNIDGARSVRGTPRSNEWRKDPRIDADVQIIREIYGAQERGLFSRGHMTRREDPNWGDPERVAIAEADTFHVTNAAPQQQGFNAGIWLELEDFILENADEENLRVSVITGPVLAETDPVYYGVRIPIDFWKIVAFTHAKTRRVTAVAYRRSQTSYLPKPQRSRFVFGDFEDTQVSIAALEHDTGLDLAAYRAIDVMEQAGPELELRLSSVRDLILRR